MQSVLNIMQDSGQNALARAFKKLAKYLTSFTYKTVIGFKKIFKEIEGNTCFELLCRLHQRKKIILVLLKLLRRKNV